MKIDFVSDVACPWCAVGLYSLETALQRVADELPVELHFQPFELNPTMRPEGEDTIEYLGKKYGASPEQLAQSREAIRQRGAAVGFTFGDRPRVWNTFDAHRLLHWAGLEGKRHQQRDLKHALLAAYHTRAENPGARDVLLRLAGEWASTWSAPAPFSTATSSPPRCETASASTSSRASTRCRRSSSTTAT